MKKFPRNLAIGILSLLILFAIVYARRDGVWFLVQVHVIEE